MTLQFALLIIVSAATAVLAAAKWHAFACAYLERLREQEHWVGRFARGARVILNDDRVPERVGAKVDKLARNRYYVALLYARRYSRCQLKLAFG